MLLIPHSSDYIRAIKSPIKEIYIKMELYDKSMNFLREITKKVNKNDVGSISVDSSRPVRRSFSFGLFNKDNEFDWGETNLIWINKRVKLFVGIKTKNGDIEYIPQGVFILTEPKDSHTLDGGKVTNVTGQDLMYLLTDKRGKFINETTIAVGTNIGTAIKTIASAVGITQFNFDTVTETVPYTLTYQSGDNRYKALEELALLAKCDIYFDVYGLLRLRKIDLNEFDTVPSVWSFAYGDGFYAGSIRTMDETDLANHVIVLGGSSQTAVARYELVVQKSDPLWANSPYVKEEIGDIIYYHNNGSPDPLLNSNDECKWRAKYELKNRLGYSERVSLSISPLYTLDGNDVIEITDNHNSVSGKYLIKSFSLPINPQTMTLECLKYRKVITDWNFI